MKLEINLKDVSETAFVTLQCHALDARSQRPYLNDKSAIHTMDLLKTHFAASERSLHKTLLKNKVQSSLIAHTALRAKKYDQNIRSFINQFPAAAVVNVGCGLDHRFERVDNGKISFYDLDLQGIIDIKRQIFPETNRYHQISQSVFDFDWIDKIQNEHVILVAEGVFMYCREGDVKALFFKLQEKLRNPEIVFEVFSSKWLSGWRKSITEFKLKKQLKFGEGASYQFGIPDSDAIESWDKGMKLLEEWSYLDSDELNPGIMKLMGKSKAMRKVQWTVHYRLNK
jgi:O-methyltransferase involved in polyketide biosynthesis